MTKRKSFRLKNRLVRRDDFVRLFDGPEVFKALTFLVFSKERKISGFPSGLAIESRLGITFKGYIGSVLRNRIKRKVRESFRCGQDPIATDHNVLFKVQAPANGRDKDYIGKLLKNLDRDLQKWQRYRQKINA